MKACTAIGWFILMLANIFFIFQAVGYSGLTSMFPEGKRWYHLPVQLTSLATFAALVHWNPF